MVHKVLGRPVNDITWALPPNDATAGLAHAIATAHHEYLRQRKLRPDSVTTTTTTTTTTIPSYDVVVVVVVQAGERNIGDQKMLEVALWSNHHIKMRRVTLAQLATHGALDGDRALLLGERRKHKKGGVYP